MSPHATPTSRPPKGRQKGTATKASSKKAAVPKRVTPTKATKDVKKREQKTTAKTLKEAAPKKVAKPKDQKVVQSKAEKIKNAEKEAKSKKTHIPEPVKKKSVKEAKPIEAPVKEPKPVRAEKEKTAPQEITEIKEEKKKKTREPKIKFEAPEIMEEPPEDLDEFEDAPKKRGRKKKIDLDEPILGESKQRGKRSGGMRRIVDEFLDPEPLLEEDELISPDELDPLELPLELLDPELVEVPRTATSHSVPKPKVPKGDRRMQKCASCGGMFAWLSVDQQCFTCLKKAIAKRKRDDESYSDYPSEGESDDDDI